MCCSAPALSTRAQVTGLHMVVTNSVWACMWVCVHTLVQACTRALWAMGAPLTQRSRPAALLPGI